MEPSMKSSFYQELKFPVQVKKEKISWHDDQEAKPIEDVKPADNMQQADDSSAVLSVQSVQKRARTRFTVHQKAELEAAFMSAPYIAPQKRLLLATRLRVTPLAIQSWFKNRRFKWRKEMKEGSQPLSPVAAYSPLPYDPLFGSSGGHVPAPVHCLGCQQGRHVTRVYPYGCFEIYGYPPS